MISYAELLLLAWFPDWNENGNAITDATIVGGKKFLYFIGYKKI
jgi:hypothetical protein